jgi:thymidylate kinase
LIVVIEGMDAAGKATQSKLLAEKIGATRFTFPNYDSPTGQIILGHLKKEWMAMKLVGGHCTCADSVCDAQVFQSLQTVNRLESLPAIEYAQKLGSIVLDRYWQSAVVYGALDELDSEWLRLVQERPMPPADVNILIDIPVEEGFKRRPERRDRYEVNREFLEKVRIEYLKLWGVNDLDCWRQSAHGIYGETSRFVVITKRPGWWVVDGRGSVEETQGLILQVLACEK